MNEKQLRDAIAAHPMMQRMKALCDQFEATLKHKSAGASAEPDNATDEDLLPVAALPESERPQHPVLDALRLLRPFVERSGDRKAIDAFNSAMRAAKRGNVGPAQHLIAAYDWQPPQARPGDYEDMMKALHRQSITVGNGPLRPPESEGETRRAQDRQPAQETYEELVGRARRKALSEPPRRY